MTMKWHQQQLRAPQEEVALFLQMWAVYQNQLLRLDSVESLWLQGDWRQQLPAQSEQRTPWMPVSCMYGWLNLAADTKRPLCAPLRSLGNMRQEEGKRLSPTKTPLLATQQVDGLFSFFLFTQTGCEHRFKKPNEWLKAAYDALKWKI